MDDDHIHAPQPQFCTPAGPGHLYAKTLTMMAVFWLMSACSQNGLPLGCAAPDINSLYVHSAASCGAGQPVFARFVAAGEDINADNVLGDRPLHLAADEATLKAILANGADVSLVNGYRETALHHAARNQSDFSPDSIAILVAAGADINGSNHERNTPLHVAAKQTAWRPNHFTRALIMAGADINARNADGNTALHLAILQTRSKEIDIEDAIYATASLGLTVAFRYSQDGLGRGALNMIDLLVAQGADTNIRNNDGLTARGIAIEMKKNAWVLDRLDKAIAARD